MEARAKLFGHAIHPILIVFPLGLLAMAVIFDALRLIAGWGLGVSSFHMIASGVVSGLVAAVFGAVDWASIPPGTRAKRVGALHGLGNVVGVALFAASWWLRRADPAAPSTIAFLLALLGAGLATVTGWLGGELVDRLGVGVDDGAHLDAPSSLRGPVRARAMGGD